VRKNLVFLKLNIQNNWEDFTKKTYFLTVWSIVSYSLEMKIFIVLKLFISIGLAAVAGDFSSHKILPGYITFDKSSPFYQGIQNESFRLSYIDKKTPSQILESFFQDGQFSNKLFKEFLGQIELMKNQTLKYFCIDEFRKKVDSYAECDVDYYAKNKFQKKWNRSKNAIIFSAIDQRVDFILKNSSSLNTENLNSIENQNFYLNFFSLFELFTALTQAEVQNGKRDSVVKSIYKVKNLVVQKNEIHNHNLHSSNLKNIHNLDQLFYSYEALNDLKDNGYDLSKLDPYDSELWRKPKKSVSQLNLSNYENTGHRQLEKVFKKSYVKKFTNPDEIIDIVYKGDNLSGGKTPKFDVFINDVKFKLKFITYRNRARPTNTPQSAAIRNMWGSEANVEPAVNQIAHALGYNVDPTYFKKQVRFYIDEEELGQSFDEALIELINNLHKRYMIESNINDSFSNIKTDENGRRYILLKSVSLEQKSNTKTDINIGFYRHLGLGKSLKREHRALYLFMAWIADPDIKDDNTKVKLVAVTKNDGSVNYKVVLSNSDMGGAIGIGYPNLYNYGLVKKYNSNSLRLRYFRLFDYNMRDAINFDDARWIVRRMSQLSIDQLTDAFEYAGFPFVVAKYYALLMSKKRNELIKALGLEGDTFIDDGGKEFTITLSEDFNGTIEGYEEYFRNYHLVDPDNKLFNSQIEDHPRYWGVSWKNSDIEGNQRNFYKDFSRWLLTKFISISQKQVFDRTHIGAQGLSIYRKNLFLDDKLINFGDWFVHGLDLGVMGIIPLRHIIENPDKESENPFLLLDVVRFGTYFSVYNPIFEKLGIAPENLGIEGLAGAKIFYLKEAIKVTPVKSFADYFKYPRPALNVNKLDWKNFAEDKILDIKEEDNYLVSHYIGGEAGMRLRPLQYFPVASILSGVGSVAAKRYLIGRKDNNILVRKTKENLNFFSNAINLFDMLLKIPLIKYDLSRENMLDKIYVFDKDENSSDLIKCININFSNTCERYINKTRQTLTRTSRFYAGFLGLFGIDIDRRYVYTNFTEDNGDNYYERSARLGNTRLSFNQILGVDKRITSEVYTNSDNDVSLVIDYSYENPATKSYQFVEAIDEVASLLPDDILSLRDDILHKYMGHVLMNINIIFNSEALKKFFEISDNELCYSYVAHTNVTNFDCDNLLNLNPEFFAILNEREKNYKFYYNLVHENILYLKNKNLKKLAKFFMDKKFELNLVNFLIGMTDKDNFRRDIHIVSDMSPFPNDMQEIKESDDQKGKLDKFTAKKFKMYGDKLIEDIHNFFFSRYSVY
jgi:hypothetical protein